MKLSYLGSNGLFDAAELLEGGIPVGPGLGEDGENELHAGLDRLADGLEVGLRPVVGEGDDLGRIDFDAHLRT